jgi:type II secretory pathway pseudopilin PulG
MERRSPAGEATRRPWRAQCGYTFIGLLVAVVILGLMLTIVARVWSTTEQREREAQLLWIGDAYRMAISSYVSMGQQYPLTLEVLLTDDRFPVPKRHLRQLYADPMTGKADWTLIMNPGGGIMGVASSSKAAPIKRKGFELIDAAFADTDCYCAWQFIYFPRRFRAPLPSGVNVPPSTAPGPANPGPFNPGPLNPGPFNPGSNTSPSGGGQIAPGITNPFPPMRPQ